MDDMKIINTCPLGNTCEEAKDKAIYRCQWYQEVIGSDPQSGTPIKKRKCAIVLNNSLLIEVSKQLRGTQRATETFRNVFSDSMKGVLQIAYTNKKNNGG